MSHDHTQQTAKIPYPVIASHQYAHRNRNGANI